MPPRRRQRGSPGRSDRGSGPEREVRQPADEAPGAAERHECCTEHEHDGEPVYQHPPDGVPGDKWASRPRSPAAMTCRCAQPASGLQALTAIRWEHTAHSNVIWVPDPSGAARQVPVPVRSPLTASFAVCGAVADESLSRRSRWKPSGLPTTTRARVFGATVPVAANSCASRTPGHHAGQPSTAHSACQHRSASAGICHCETNRYRRGAVRVIVPAYARARRPLSCRRRRSPDRRASSVNRRSLTCF